MSREDHAADRRSGWLTALLPGLIVACLYAVWDRPRKLAAIDRVESELRSVRPQVPASGQLSVALDRVEELREQVRLAREKRDAAEAARAGGSRDATPAPADPSDPTLVDAILASGLLLVSEGPGDARVVEATGRVTGVTPSRARKLELSGSYQDMLQALVEIARLTPAPRILELTLARDAGFGGIKWTLTVG